jgi:predicted HD phosphohydrolase
MSFSKMEHGTLEDWLAIGVAVSDRQSRMAETILALLKSLETQVDGFSVSQLEHSLQTATRASRAGASDELVVAALCHDIGKSISVENHAAIGAEILRPYVSEGTYQILRTHQDFQGKHYYALMGKSTRLRNQYRHEPWYEQACTFTDEWDQASFEAGYDSQPLSFFEPLVRRVFAQMRVDPKIKVPSPTLTPPPAVEPSL